MEKELNDFIASGVVGGLVVLLFKILWDWLRTGRMEKGVYMLVAECEKRQLACGMPYVRSEMTKLLSRSNEYKATTDTRLKEIEKQLDQGRNDFISVMGDLSQIRQTLASMPTALSFSTVKTDISEIKESIARVQTVIEYSLQHTEHHD